MKKICLINSYNYAEYLPECIGSAVNQTVAFDEIIVVDDGSIDDSRKVIDNFTQSSKVKITSIYKENGGQLSALNAAFGFINDGDQVFILDSDDFYPPDYIELMLKSMGDCPWDVSFVAQVPFKSPEVLVTAAQNTLPNFSFENTSAIVRARQIWVGNPSSCISLSGSLFNKIFPYPHIYDFITRADDVIVYASSVIGAHKTFIRSIGTGWRVHKTNNTQKIVDENLDERQDRLNRLFLYYSSKYSLAFPALREEYLAECFTLNLIQKQFLNSLLGPAHEPF